MPRCVCHLRQPLPESITSIRRGAALIEMYIPRFVGNRVHAKKVMGHAVLRLVQWKGEALNFVG
jgi:hypothetical protein